jgi:hypothetical protein
MPSKAQSRIVAKHIANRALLIGLPIFVTLAFCFGYGMYQHRPGGSMSHVDNKKASSAVSHETLRADTKPNYTKLDPAPQPSQASQPTSNVSSPPSSTSNKSNKQQDDTENIDNEAQSTTSSSANSVNTAPLKISLPSSKLIK